MLKMAAKSDSKVCFDYGTYGFLIIAIIVLAIVLGTLIANTVYFSKIHGDGGSPQVTASSALALARLNGFMALVVGILFIMALIRLLVNASALSAFKAAAGAKPIGVVGYVPGAGVVTSYAPGSTTFTEATLRGPPTKQVVIQPTGQYTAPTVIIQPPAPASNVLPQTFPSQASGASFDLAGVSGTS